MTWRLGRFYAWDLESTGVDLEADRVVTSTLVSIEGADTTSREWLVNPGIPIPAEATAIHGITEDYAKAAGDDPDAACGEIMQALYGAWDAGCPVVIFNGSFDCTLLDRELRRHHGVGLEIRGPIIDPYVADKHLDKWRRGKRTLSALCEHYNVKLEGTHSSTGDALAAARLAYVMSQVYPELVDLASVNELQASWRAEWAADYQRYVEAKGGTEFIDPHWPLRPYREPAVAS